MSSKYNSKRDSFIGWGLPQDKEKLNASEYLGALIYHEGEEVLYYSNGSEWISPENPPIRRPYGLAPVTTSDRSKLRLSAFSSFDNLYEKTGMIFQMFYDQAGTQPVYFPETTKPVNNILCTIDGSVAGSDPTLPVDEFDGKSSTRNFFQIPMSWLKPNTTFYWRGKYTAVLKTDPTNTQESVWSEILEQQFPPYIEQPSSLIEEKTGVYSGEYLDISVLKITDYISPFEKAYLTTEWEIWKTRSTSDEQNRAFRIMLSDANTTDKTDPEPLLAEIERSRLDLIDGKYYEGTYPNKVLHYIKDEHHLKEGTTYFWRAKYKGAGDDGSTIETQWTPLIAFVYPKSYLELTIDLNKESQSTNINLPLFVVRDLPAGSVRLGDPASTSQSKGYVDIDWGNITVEPTEMEDNTGKFKWWYNNNTQSYWQTIHYPFDYSYTSLGTKTIIVKSGSYDFVNGVWVSSANSGDVIGYSNNPWGSNDQNTIYPTDNYWRDLTPWSVSSGNHPYKPWTTDQLIANEILTTHRVVDIKSFGNTLRYFKLPSNNLREVSDYLPPSVRRLDSAFKNSVLFNQDLNYWNTKNVIDLRSTFENSSAFNGNISTWDTSSVTGEWNSGWGEMGGFLKTFKNSKAFNGGLAKWNTSNCTLMREMFNGAVAFNQPLSGWDTSEMLYCDYMFANSTAFNADISLWDMSQVLDLNHMFYNAASFNQPIGDWNVQACSNFKSMFEGAIDFNQNISNWGMSATPDVDMSRMFYNAVKYDKPINPTDPNKWNCVIDTSYMFYNAKAFNSDVSGIDVSNVTTMTNMFAGTQKFNPTLTLPWLWNVSKCLNFTNIFAGAKVFDQDISLWDFTQTPLIINSFADAGSGKVLATIATNSITAGSTYKLIITSTNYKGIYTVTAIGNAGSPTNQFTFTHTFTGTETGTLTFAVDTSYMFSGADKFGVVSGSVADWDVSNVTNMTGMFTSTNSFNGDLNSWNVSNVETMNAMFSGAYVFNKPLSNWKLDNVTNVTSMFANARKFDQNLDAWRFPKLTSLNSMFAGAWDFGFKNGSVAGWDVSNITDMTSIFSGADSFNNNLNSWNMSKVTTTAYMFYSADKFNSNLSNWDVSKITNANNMFAFAGSFQGNGLNTWNPVLLSNASEMFRDNPVFDATVTRSTNTWNTLALTNAYAMFYNCPKFRGTGIETWYTSKITQATHMFSYCVGTSKTGYFNPTLTYVRNADPNLERWNVSNITSAYAMFHKCNQFQGNGLDTWTPLRLIDGGHMFSYTKLSSVDLGSWLFNTIPGYSFSKMDAMFSDSPSYEGNGLGGWDIRNVNNMNSTFANCTNFVGDNNMATWNTSNVTDMTALFQNTKFNQDISNWNISKVTNFSYMFYGNTNFNKNIGGTGLDDGKWKLNTLSNINMTAMFYGATAFNQDLSKWDMSKVVNTNYMFYDATSYNNGGVSLANWSTGNLQYVDHMFYGAKVFNQPVTNWNTSKVKTMEAMFYNASAFDRDISNWNIPQTDNMNNMFVGVTLSPTNYNKLLNAWGNPEYTTKQRGVKFHAGNSKFSDPTAASRKANLRDVWYWQITDGGSV